MTEDRAKAGASSPADRDRQDIARPGAGRPARSQREAHASARRPQIGDTRPAPVPSRRPSADGDPVAAGSRRRRSGGPSRGARRQTQRPSEHRDDLPSPRGVGGSSDSRESSRGSGSGGSSGSSGSAGSSGSRRRRGRASSSRGSAGQGQGVSEALTERSDAGRAQDGSRSARARPAGVDDQSEALATGTRRRRGRRGGRGSRGGAGRAGSGVAAPVEAITVDDPVELDAKALKGRRGRSRRGQALGRYLMCVHVGENATQIAVLEGRRLIEFQVSRPSDEISQIHGNIYLGLVQNVLPGMETSFVDIGTPKNAVLYRGDVQHNTEEIEAQQPDADRSKLRIEQLLRPGQSVLCQVTKNPIGEKGARLTQEVSLAGRFVVLVPNSSGFGISKRLRDAERRRLRSILERVRPAGHGLIMRTAAENVTAEEIERDVARLVSQWNEIRKRAESSRAPALLYREPEAPLRLIREELNADFRGVIIDDRGLYDSTSSYISSIIGALSDRVQFYDTSRERLPLFERYYVTEQLRKALDSKVWLPSGGSLIIEHTEALTVVDVNTGKNVGKSSLRDTVLDNNLEAADELARQLRLRDIGGIIVVDFVDMDQASDREMVAKRFREALARDKPRTQVLEISGLGLLEMTRKRSGEGLLESLSDLCADCSGRGYKLLEDLIA